MILDGSTVRDFVEDKAAFEAAMEVRFKETDLNDDGMLSRSELRTVLEHVATTWFIQQQEEIKND